MTVFVPDVSEFQSNVDAPSLIGAGYKAIIVRVAYGNVEDRLAAQGRVGYMRSQPFKALGWYLFFRSAVSVQSQIAEMEAVLGRLGANEFVVVDWERDLDGSLPSRAARDQVLQALTAWGGRPTVLYGPASLLRQQPSNAPEWPASYETGDPRLPGEVLWQYTDGRYTSGGYRPVNFPGIGLCDASVYPGSYEQFCVAVGVEPAPGPDPTPTPVTMSNIVAAAATGSGAGYWLVDAVGHVFCHGDAVDRGQAPSPLARPIVGAALDPASGGLWLTAADGGVFGLGAPFYGGAAGQTLGKPVCGIAVPGGGGGYWLVGGDGGVYAYGDVSFCGSMGGRALAAPVVGLAPTATGKGYWMVAADGGVFSFGDAQFFGSVAGTVLGGPIVAVIATRAGNGYWMFGSDGGVYAFGDAQYFGSMGGKPMAKPVVAALRSPSGNGYALVGGDGGVFAFGDFTFEGAGA